MLEKFTETNNNIPKLLFSNKRILTKQKVLYKASKAHSPNIMLLISEVEELAINLEFLIQTLIPLEEAFQALM